MLETAVNSLLIWLIKSDTLHLEVEDVDQHETIYLNFHIAGDNEGFLLQSEGTDHPYYLVSM